jgi:transcriptional regulator with XRE-family HTH domain
MSDEEARDRRKTLHIDRPLGERLRLERDARGLSRDWVAGRLDVSNSTVQRYEEGRTRIPAARLWQLCDLLGLSVSEVFTGLPHQIVRADAPAGAVEEGTPLLRDDGRSRRTAALARDAARLSDDRLVVAELLVQALRTPVRR